ncbi:MAG: ABC transporter permease [Tannerella sp.]|jgi:putative ABC transport system permease protein|nr:ABC transporter permease [Tannerella sp.]
MKTIIRNFLNVLHRFKVATVLNILGLSLAFAAFIVILIQVKYEQRFDTCHPKAGRIFLVDLMRQGATSEYASTIHSRAFIDEIIASSAAIDAVTLYNPFVGEVYLSVDGEDTDKKGFQEKIVTCYPGITDIFGFVFIEGNAESLHDPEKVIIPESMARRFWGISPAVGKIIHMNEDLWTKNVKTLTVGGVYKDFPGNTQIDNAIYGTIDNTMKDNWESNNFICYVLLNNGETSGVVVENLNKTFDFSRVWNPDGDKLSLAFVPLTDVHYSKEKGGLFKTSEKKTVGVLFMIALLVIIIAAINFTNFSIALAPLRIKSINTQKVFGCSIQNQRRTLITEAVGVAFTAWLLSLFLVWMLNKNQILPFIDADLSFYNNSLLILFSGGLALLIGSIAGMYPAWYMTSFQPALVLKGNFGTSPSGRFLRFGLVSFQYIISTGLIITALFIQLQNNYMRSYDYGFEKDQVAVVQLNGDIYNTGKDTYVNKLKEYPGIEDVAFSKQKLGARDGYTTYGLKYGDNTFYSYVLEVSPSFPKVMGIPVIEGRDFLPTDEQANELMYIFSKPLQQMVGMEAGSLIEMESWRGAPGHAVGITGDVKFTSLRQGTDGISFMINSHESLPVSYIRLKAGTNITEAVNHIRNVVAGIDPTFPFELEFYDTIFNQLYYKELSLTKTIMLFSILAIVISIVGVFGLILFETQFRRKEIGVRKVLGAGIKDILIMFNRTYMHIVCISFVLAAPVGYYAVTKWLENFAYKTPIHWWVFLIAFLLISAITILTITFQNWQAARTNPVDSIKTE